MEKIKFCLFISLFVLIAGCNESDDFEPPPPKDCVFLTEDFADCPTEAATNLCVDLSCDIAVDDNMSVTIISRECNANDCFSMTCKLRQPSFIGSQIIGEAVLSIEEFDDFLSGHSTLV